MYKDKSFFTSNGQIYSNLKETSLKSRSLSSKSFAQQRINDIHQKQYIGGTYDRYQFQPNLQEINFSHNPS